MVAVSPSTGARISTRVLWPRLVPPGSTVLSVWPFLPPLEMARLWWIMLLATAIHTAMDALVWAPILNHILGARHPRCNIPLEQFLGSKTLLLVPWHCQSRWDRLWHRRRKPEMGSSTGTTLLGTYPDIAKAGDRFNWPQLLSVLSQMNMPGTHPRRPCSIMSGSSSTTILRASIAPGVRLTWKTTGRNGLQSPPPRYSWGCLQHRMQQELAASFP